MAKGNAKQQQQQAPVRVDPKELECTILAARDIKVTGGKIRKRGEPVPEALDWSYPVFKAELAHGNIIDPENQGEKHFRNASPAFPKLADRMGDRVQELKELQKERQAVASDDLDEDVD